MSDNTKTVKEAFSAYLKSLNSQYGQTLQANNAPQLSNAQQIIDTAIGSVNVGRLSSGTARIVVDAMQDTIRILNQTDSGFTDRILNGDFKTVLGTTIKTILAKDIFSDANILSYLEKINDDVLKGVFKIGSPLIMKTVSWLENKAYDFIDNIDNVSWSEAKEVSNACSDLTDQIATGEVIENSTLANMDNEINTWDKSEDVALDREYDKKNENQEWHIIDTETGNDILNFTSYIEDDLSANGNSVNYPIEEGQFKSYNKVNDGKIITITVAKEGSNTEIQDFFATLEELRNSTKLFNIVTPSIVIESLTLNSWHLKRDNTTNAWRLIAVELDLQEVRTTTIERKQTKVSMKQTKSNSTVDTKNMGTANTYNYDNNNQQNDIGELAVEEKAYNCIATMEKRHYDHWADTYANPLVETISEAEQNEMKSYLEEQDLSTVFMMWNIEPEIMAKYTGMRNKDEWYQSTDWYRGIQNAIEENKNTTTHGS